MTFTRLAEAREFRESVEIRRARQHAAAAPSDQTPRFPDSLHSATA